MSRVMALSVGGIGGWRKAKDWRASDSVGATKKARVSGAFITQLKYCLTKLVFCQGFSVKFLTFRNYCTLLVLRKRNRHVSVGG
jgi:hypothetical protein